MANLADFIKLLERVSPLFETMTVPLAIYSVEGKFVHGNAALCNLVGVSFIQDIYQLEILDAVSRLASSGREAVAAALEKNSEFVSLEQTIYHTSNGSSIPILTRFKRAELDGEMIGILARFDDLTAYRALEVQASREYQQFRGLFDRAPDPITSVDLNGNYVRINGAAEALYGYQCSELVGIHISKVFPGVRSPLDMILRAIDRREKVEYEATAIRKDGRHLRVRGIAVPQIIDGVVVGFYKFSRPLSSSVKGSSFAESVSEVVNEEPLLTESAPDAPPEGPVRRFRIVSSCEHA